MTDNEKEKTIRVMCASCGHKHRNHRVLHEKVKRYSDGPYEPVSRIDYHRFVECMGCESLKYVTSTEDPYERDQYEGGGEQDFKVYPDAPGTPPRRAAGISDDDLRSDDGTPLIPETVWKMYKETLDALNGGIRTLSAGGLRATVEAICLDSGITNGTLQQKIDELSNQNLLTTSQAALLHEERYLGNAALHELETPSNQAIEDGLGIVEGLMNTIYILPHKAERLRNRRQGS